MDRSQFLISLIAGVIGINSIAFVNVDKILDETKLLSDNEFITYVTIQFKMIMTNPRNCAIITNISIPDGY